MAWCRAGALISLDLSDEDMTCELDVDLLSQFYALTRIDLSNNDISIE